MLRPILLVQAALALLSIVHAAPLALVGRQQLGAISQLQTVQTTQTNQGLMTQTCTITLTPVTDANGNAAVQEVQTCTVAMGSANGQANGGNPSTPPSNTNTTSSGSSGGLAGSAGALSSVPNTFTQTASASSGSATSAASSGGSVSVAGNVDGFSSVAATALASLASLGAHNAAATGTATGITAGATAAAANAAAVSATPTAQTQFALPGKKLSVLPIGLGVFAGISVIALIVVGLVTYERTKYRKAFRQRKLAEAGSAMGYGGMAQRT